MNRSGIMTMAAAVVMALSISTTRADSVGSQGFADLGSPSVSPGTSINTATVFNIGSLITNSTSTGVWAGVPTQSFGAVSFDITNPTSLSFGNAIFGTFSSTSITEISNSLGQVSFYVLGDMAGGSYTGTLTPNPAPASFTISFTQSPAETGAISDSATLSIPPANNPVPEPSSMVLVGLGMASLGALRYRRKS